MNKTAIYSTIVVSVIASLAVFAVSSSEVQAEPPSKVACPAENVQHWLNVRFNNQVALRHDTEPEIVMGTALLIPIPIVGSELFSSSNTNQLIADRLNEIGYFVAAGGVRAVESSDVSGSFSNNTPFSTICAEN